jgi:hypothetical protein
MNNSLTKLPECESNQLWIPASRTAALAERVAKLNRKADKLNMPRVSAIASGESVTIHRQWVELDLDGDTVNRESYTRYVLFTFSGSSPSIDGWRMIAVIDHQDKVNILRAVPGYDEILPHRYRDIGATCDHCNTDRKRNETYVILHDDGRHMAIGRNCLADFMPSQDMQAIALWFAGTIDPATIAGDCIEEFGGMRDLGTRTLSKVLNLALFVSEKFGYVSSTKARDSFGALMSTADVCRRLMIGNKLTGGEKRLLADADETQAAREPQVTAIIEHFAANPNPASEYEYTLYALTQNDMVDAKSYGYAVSMPSAYDRALQRKAEQAARINEWIGNTGDKLTLNVRIVSAKWIDTDYGTSRMITMADAEGRSLKVFSTAKSAEEVVTGDEWDLTAKVKRHESYNGRMITLLSHPKFTKRTKQGLYSTMADDAEQAA